MTRPLPSPSGRAPGGMRSAAVRTANLSQVISALHLRGSLTRSEISSETGLTRSSVAVQVSELTEAGLVVERAPQPDGRPGRPSPLVAFNPAVAALAVEIEVASIAVGVFRLGGECIARRRVGRAGATTTPDDAVRLIGELVEDLRSEADGPTILGAGVGVAGLVEEAEGRVAMAPNLGWSDVPLGDLLAEELGDVRRIRVGNEANVSARAESVRGAGRATSDMIYISGEVGVGGGVISNGRPLTGRSGFGGEIGHLTANPGGRPCGCGSIGCWETEIGARAVLERAELDPDGGEDAVAVLWDRADRGDATARRALAETGRWLGIGIASLVNVFNPDVVVLGGMYRRGHAHLIETVLHELDRRVLPPLRGAAIVPSVLGDSAVLVGAAELAVEDVLMDPLSAVSLH